MEFNELDKGIKQAVFKMVVKNIKNRNNGICSLKKNIDIFDKAIKEILNSDLNNAFKKEIKNVFKLAYLIDNDDKLFFDENPFLINQGLHTDDEYGETWDYWYLFNAKNEKEVIESIEKYGYEKGITLEGIQIHSDYDCTGRTFAYDMKIKKVGENRFLATKHFGLDV